MKRDIELVKEILIAVEKQKGLDSIDAEQLEIKGWSTYEINYNADLMGKAGLLETERMDFMGGG